MPQKPSLQPRSWGTRFDTLPISPPVSPSATKIAPMSAPVEAARYHSPSGKKEDKMPHDASIFVGSLPTNMEQQELTRALYDHLSEHTEIKNIKVIRDSKGGICAFVQCEDAPSSAKLIQNLHSNPPRPFMGRLLRFEPARAFRTLLISYRTPLQYVSPEGVDQSQMPADSLQAMELELPTAMRLSRNKNSRFFSILYNGDATSAENLTSGPRGQDKTLLLSPLTFNSESLRRLSTYFGPLEHFIPYSAPVDVFEGENHVDPWNIYPAPHNASRKAHMDSTCWEVKWNHRDDCVSALTTLRRVPHLTATWAHQASSSACNQSPHISSPGAAQYPLHVQLQGTPLSSSTSVQRMDIGGIVSGHDLPQLSPSALKLGDDTSDPFSDTATGSTGRLIWSEVDFPPLEDYLGHPGSQRNDDPQNTSITQLSHHFNQFRISSAMERGKPRGGLEHNFLNLKQKSMESPVPKSASPTLSVPTSSTNAMEGSTDNDAKREVDPTTLFVGGLDLFGPHSWSEERLTHLFSKYEGLEHVKVVRPVNARSGFAFVRFNNKEAPLRAVLGEHNRVHNGRLLRVQLRDCNPSRTFRPPRSRTHSVLRQDEQGGVPPSEEDSSVTAPCDTSPSSTEPDLPSFATLTNAQDQVGVADEQQDKGEPTDNVAGDLIPQDESHYREWYDLPSTQESRITAGHLVPVPNPTHIVPHQPYHMHSGGYYPPPPYMQTYPYPVPFQVPYYGYHYPIHGQQMPQSYYGPASPDQSQPPSMQPWTPTAFHSPYAPYAPQVTRSPATEQPQNHPAPNQPPVAPTGFIQNDQGPLFAMYQPEALDQYMTTSGQTQPAVLASNQAQNVAPWSHLQSNTPYRTGAQQTLFNNRLSQPPNQLSSWPVNTPSNFQPQGNQPTVRYSSSYEPHGRMVEMQQKRVGRRDYNPHRNHHANPANRHIRVANIARPASPRDQNRALGRSSQASIDWSHWVANR